MLRLRTIMAYDAKLPLLLAGIPQVGDGKRAVEEGVDHLHVVAAAHHRKQRLGRGRGRPHREGGEVFVDLGPRVPVDATGSRASLRNSSVTGPSGTMPRARSITPCGAISPKCPSPA